MDYQRLVSYIYAYPDGMKGQNVGFAKALVHQGQFKLNISLRGVNTDSPEMFGVYMMVKDDSYRLIKLGDCLVKSGQAEYSGVFNPDNISLTEYCFRDICGLAVAGEDARFDMMLSMWKDEDVTPDMLVFAGMDAKKQAAAGDVIQEKMRRDEAKEEATERVEAKEEAAERVEKELAEEEQEIRSTLGNDGAQDIANGRDTQIAAQEEIESYDKFEKLFHRADYIDAFDDDYFYDCMEVSPEKLKSLKLKNDTIINNSFLLHGYYNFRHVLFGRVRDNLDNTRYFIGIPGMYCNRERFMASMFGFNNFKKSHRSDYANPYFGYWYQEI